MNYLQNPSVYLLLLWPPSRSAGPDETIPVGGWVQLCTWSRLAGAVDAVLDSDHLVEDFRSGATLLTVERHALSKESREWIDEQLRLLFDASSAITCRPGSFFDLRCKGSWQTITDEGPPQPLSFPAMWAMPEEELVFRLPEFGTPRFWSLLSARMEAHNGALNAPKHRLLPVQGELIDAFRPPMRWDQQRMRGTPDARVRQARYRLSNGLAEQTAPIAGVESSLTTESESKAAGSASAKATPLELAVLQGLRGAGAIREKHAVQVAKLAKLIGLEEDTIRQRVRKIRKSGHEDWIGTAARRGYYLLPAGLAILDSVPDA